MLGIFLWKRENDPKCLNFRGLYGWMLPSSGISYAFPLLTSVECRRNDPAERQSDGRNDDSGSYMVALRRLPPEISRQNPGQKHHGDRKQSNRHHSKQERISQAGESHGQPAYGISAL